MASMNETLRVELDLEKVIADGKVVRGAFKHKFST